MDGIIPLILDRPRSLRFGINAIALVEPLLSVELSTILNARRMSIGDMRALLYASLKWEDERLTLERVGDLMEEAAVKDPEFFAETVERVFKAVVACRLFKRGDPNAQAEATATPAASANGSPQPGATPTDHSGPASIVATRWRSSAPGGGAEA
jgi:hypothetical protein